MPFFIQIKTYLTNTYVSWRSISTNKIISFTTYISLVLSISSSIAIILLWNRLPPVLPLWYSKPWGIERLASPYWLFLLPLSSMSITMINASLTSTFAKEYLIFAQIVSCNSFIISFLSTITLIKIILIVL